MRIPFLSRKQADRPSSGSISEGSAGVPMSDPTTADTPGPAPRVANSPAAGNPSTMSASEESGNDPADKRWWTRLLGR